MKSAASSKSAKRAKVAKRTTVAKRGKVGTAAVDVPTSFRPLVKALGGEPGVTVEQGWGSSNVVLKLSSKMFVMLVGDDLVAKLPRARVDELVADGKGTRFDPRRNGKVMKEWVVVVPGNAKWLALAREAHAFARSLA